MKHEEVLDLFLHEDIQDMGTKRRMPFNIYMETSSMASFALKHKVENWDTLLVKRRNHEVKERYTKYFTIPNKDMRHVVFPIDPWNARFAMTRKLVKSGRKIKVDEILGRYAFMLPASNENKNAGKDILDAIFTFRDKTDVEGEEKFIREYANRDSRNGFPEKVSEKVIDRISEMGDVHSHSQNSRKFAEDISNTVCLKNISSKAYPIKDINDFSFEKNLTDRLLGSNNTRIAEQGIFCTLTWKIVHENNYKESKNGKARIKKLEKLAEKRLLQIVEENDDKVKLPLVQWLTGFNLKFNPSVKILKKMMETTDNGMLKGQIQGKITYFEINKKKIDEGSNEIVVDRSSYMY